MINNFTISQLTLNLLFISPFISRSSTLGKNNFNSFYNINCAKSSYSFFYSSTNIYTTIKSSSFSKFHGHSPIFIDSKFYFTRKSDHSFCKKQILEQDDKNVDSYELQLFYNPQFFSELLNVSVIFNQCTFLDCINKNSQGGAISFRKEAASLIIESCIFIRCQSFHSSGAIYIVQLYNGYWLDGDVNITNSNFEECCDCEPRTNYVAGVIDAYVMNGDNHHAFLLQNSKFVDCQFDKKNKITEAQIRINANTLYFNYNNFSNNNNKIDASAILFIKYVKEKSSISFLNAFNQNGFSFFEIYDLQSGYIHAYDINMVNTTFVNFRLGSVLIKVAFFNIFFAFENCFYLDNFFAIDFTTICTDEGEVDYDLVEPVIIQIPDKCAYPNTYNIFSNQPMSKTNQIDYSIVPKMKYDYNRGIILNMPQIEETPLPTPSISSTPAETSDFPIQPIRTTIPLNPNDLFDSIQSQNKKANIKIEIIIIAVVGLVTIVASIIIIVNVIVQKKRNISFQSKHQNNDENEDNSSDDDNSSENEDDNESHQNDKTNNHSDGRLTYELFYNPKNKSTQSDISKKKTIIDTFVNDDPFKNDIEEYSHFPE